MKNLLLLALGGALLAPPSFAQSGDNISIAEFRQTLTDYLTVADAHRGTNYAPLMAAVPDSTLQGWYQGVPNGRRFQQAVASVKAHMYQRKNAAIQSRIAGMSRAAYPATSPAGYPVSRNAAGEPRAALSSFPNAAGITSVVAPDFTLFTPNFPSGPNWSIMTGVIQGLGYLGSGDASDLGCDIDQETNLVVIVSTFHGVKDAAEKICDIVPDIAVIILGEGSDVPAKEICFGINLIIGGFNSAFDGFLSDCATQDGLVDSVHTTAAYHNSLSLYNFELRLSIEENLQNTTGPVGIFELPGTPDGNGGFKSDGAGYLEMVRSVVADTLNNLAIAGVNVATANASLLAGDTQYNLKNYKGAYKSYQKAYGLAVQ